MKSPCKKLIALLLLPALIYANDGKFSGKFTKEKTVKKEFKVNANAELIVDNSYGNVEITTWNENQTVIEVFISTNGNDEAKVQERLDEIQIEFSGSPTLVSAKTVFGTKKNGSWSWWGTKNNNISVKVNYKIKLPLTNSVDLNNDYGNININKLEGRAKIDCDYGQLIIGELLADNNTLSFDYTNNSTIAFMKSGKIDADYSSFVLDKVGNLELSADYTDSEIGEGSEINYNCDYGKVTINKAISIIGSGDYVSNRIGTLTRTLNLNTDYGSISVERLDSTIKEVIIQADYTGIKLGFDSKANFNIDANLTYASFKGDETVTIMKSSIESNRKVYSGYHGQQHSGNSISVHSNYGGLTLIKH